MEDEATPVCTQSAPQCTKSPENKAEIPCGQQVPTGPDACFELIGIDLSRENLTTTVTRDGDVVIIRFMGNAKLIELKIRCVSARRLRQIFEQMGIGA